MGVYGQTLDLWTSIDPHLVMYTFLPPLIYGATVHVNVHVFKKSLGQVIPLAGPGVLLATFLTATFTKLWITFYLTPPAVHPDPSGAGRLVPYT